VKTTFYVVKWYDATCPEHTAYAFAQTKAEASTLRDSARKAMRAAVKEDLVLRTNAERAVALRARMQHLATIPVPLEGSPKAAMWQALRFQVI